MGIKCAWQCAEMCRNELEISPNASGNGPTTSLEHFGSRQKFRDFCSKTRPRNVCRSAKQRPRNQAILPFLHKIRQNAPSSALKCAAMSSKSHQMLVGVILQHPWNILGRVKNFAIFAPKLAPEMRGSPVSAVLGSSPGKGTPFAGKTKNHQKSILIFFLCNVDRRI